MSTADSINHELPTLDISGILSYLPHRYPFLLIDRVVDFEADTSITGIKNVTINEPFFPGHFPHKPVMPGVLILEALAQASGVLAFKSRRWQADENHIFYFVGVDNARFKQPVIPGDQLKLHVTVDKVKRDIWRFVSKATVDGKVVCSADFMCARKALSE